MMTALMSLNVRHLNCFIGTVIKTEKALVNDRLRVSKVS